MLEKTIEYYNLKLNESLANYDFYLFKNLIQEFVYRFKKFENFDLIISSLEKPFIDAINNQNELFDYNDLLDFILENIEKDVFSENLFKKMLYEFNTQKDLINNILHDEYEHLIIKFSDEVIPILENAIKHFPSETLFFDWLFKLYFNNSQKDKILSLKNKIPEKAYTAWYYLSIIYIRDNNNSDTYLALKKAKTELAKIEETTYDIVYPRPINNVIINNYCSIKEIEISNLASKKEVYFLGENGVGKTVLLQSILLGLKSAEEADKLAKLGISSIEIGNIKVSFNIGQTSLFGYLGNYPNIFAYGVGRIKTSSSNFDKTGFATLFDKQNVNLTNPVSFLKEVLLREYEKIGNLKLNEVIEMFTDILNIEDNNEITIEKKGTNFIFKERNYSPVFEELADGYRSLLLILSDLISRLLINQPDVSDIKKFKGIVLIDEIDMLLHPKLEYTIVKKLRDKLPNIQWFFTTHSPMLILGASEDAVFHKLYKEKGETKISEAWTSNDITHLMANGLITSPLFDMETARMKSLKNVSEMDTSQNFWVGKIHKKIEEQVEDEKSKGKVYFSKEEIDDLVNWAIEEIDKEEDDD